MCQYLFLDRDKCTTLMQDATNRENQGKEEWEAYENSVFPLNFSVNLEPFKKNKIFFLKWGHGFI